MNDPLTSIGTRRTPQSQPVPGREGARQKQNSAGGYAFGVSDDVRLHRFLTLGVEGGTFYAKEAEFTRDNAAVVIRFAETRGEELVRKVVEISTGGRAPKQNPAIFALAVAASISDDAGRHAAINALPQVARTGATLFLFIRYSMQFRKWGRGLRRGVRNWYLARSADDMAYQMVKYRQREGWDHAGLLRMSHPETADPGLRAAFDWATHLNDGRIELTDAVNGDALPRIIYGHILAMGLGNSAHNTPARDYARLVQEYRLPWEALPDEALTKPEVWKAMIANGMPQGALLRQLPRLTRLGVFDDAEMVKTVTEQLVDPERLKRARVHPIKVLLAMKTYAQGFSERGSSTWSPNRHVIDALDAAFYAAYGAVEKSGKRILVALDVSGSMRSPVLGNPISAREAAAALSLVTLATEKSAEVVGFASSSQPLAGAGTQGSRRPFGMAGVGGDLSYQGLAELTISPRQRLDDVVKYTGSLPFGGTDVALPMIWAGERGKTFDTFVVITDNETWAGRSMHPHQALRAYRETINPEARLVTVAMTANDVSVADPEDPLSLDIAGFDAAAPTLISDFARGDV